MTGRRTDGVVVDGLGVVVDGFGVVVEGLGVVVGFDVVGVELGCQVGCVLVLVAAGDEDVGDTPGPPFSAPPQAATSASAASTGTARSRPMAQVVAPG
jgi:hypothetical protein